MPEVPWIPEQRLSGVIVESHLATSTSEAKRLIRQGAVDIISLSGEPSTVTADVPTPKPDPSYTIKVGKRGFVRLTE
jgi:tyrosyl-tRNA synthetase